LAETGKILLNTRPQAQADKLTSLLIYEGFQVVEIPMIEIQPRSEKLPGEVSPNNFDGLFFSSLNGVQIFHAVLSNKMKCAWLNKPAYTLSRRTASEWTRLGGNVLFYPETSSLNGFLAEYQRSETLQNWLHPCSQITRLKPGNFLKKNIRVLNCPVYTPALPKKACKLLSVKFSALEGIIFTSGSAVNNFMTCLTDKTMVSDLSGRVTLFSMGSSASEALENHGINKFIEADKPNNRGLVEAVKNYWRK
jgi:uroporphyrinogen-III synthase